MINQQIEQPENQQPSSQQRARDVLVGGVNSPVRSFQAVGGEPLIIRRGLGSRLEAVGGQNYIDFINSWGPLIFGHADQDIEAALCEAIAAGVSYGLTSPYEIEFAEAIRCFFPSMEKVRLVNSGTEAALSACRLARGYAEHSGRERAKLIVKFEGCYHGHVDSLLVKAGSGLATQAGQQLARKRKRSAPSSAGIPDEYAKWTTLLPFNDSKAVEQLFRRKAESIAAVIVEPIAGNMGVVPPTAEFLPLLRRLCSDSGALLIFDEVMTGFRVAPGGAQELFSVVPDLTMLGKIVGGGLPLAAYGGRADIMRRLAPEGDVYQAGTLAGNPLAVRAGLRMLEKIASWRSPERGSSLYVYLEELGRRLEDGIELARKRYREQITFQRIGSMFTLFFHQGPVTNFEQAAAGDHSTTGPYAQFFRALLKRGVLWPPSSFESCFLSAAHSFDDIDQTAHALNEALVEVLG